MALSGHSRHCNILSVIGEQRTSVRRSLRRYLGSALRSPGLRLMIENGCESEVTSSTPHTRNFITMLVLVLAAAALAGCGASARTWAAADCWKSTEKDYAKMNIDKRADIVNKCIDDKMR